MPRVDSLLESIGSCRPRHKFSTVGFLKLGPGCLVKPGMHELDGTTTFGGADAFRVFSLGASFMHGEEPC